MRDSFSVFFFFKKLFGTFLCCIVHRMCCTGYVCTIHSSFSHLIKSRFEKMGRIFVEATNERNAFSSTVTINIEVQRRLACWLYVYSLYHVEGGKGNRLSNAQYLMLLSRSPWPSSKPPSDLICDVNFNPKIFCKSPHQAWIFLKPPAYNGKIQSFL